MHSPDIGLEDSNLISKGENDRRQAKRRNRENNNQGKYLHKKKIYGVGPIDNRPSTN